MDPYFLLLAMLDRKLDDTRSFFAIFLRVGCGRRKQQINHKLCSVLSVPEILINSTAELEPTSQLSWKSWESFMTAAALLFRR